MTKQNSVSIKDTLEKLSLLNTIQKSNQLISLSFTSLPQHCLTSLLEVNNKENILLFDEPNIVVSQKTLESKGEAYFALKINNLPITFKSKIKNLHKNIKENHFITFFPEEIHYPQYRESYRFQIKSNKEVSAKIFLSQTKQLSVQLINISLNGLRIQLPYSLASMFKKDQLIDDIFIELPNEKGFSVSTKIKNARIENNYNNITLGLQILQQRQNIEKTIQRFIFREKKI